MKKLLLNIALSLAICTSASAQTPSSTKADYIGGSPDITETATSFSYYGQQVVYNGEKAALYLKNDHNITNTINLMPILNSISSYTTLKGTDMINISIAQPEDAHILIGFTDASNNTAHIINVEFDPSNCARRGFSVFAVETGTSKYKAVRLASLISGGIYVLALDQSSPSNLDLFVLAYNAIDFQSNSRFLNSASIKPKLTLDIRDFDIDCRNAEYYNFNGPIIAYKLDPNTIAMETSLGISGNYSWVSSFTVPIPLPTSSSFSNVRIALNGNRGSANDEFVVACSVTDPTNNQKYMQYLHSDVASLGTNGSFKTLTSSAAKEEHFCTDVAAVSDNSLSGYFSDYGFVGAVDFYEPAANNSIGFKNTDFTSVGSYVEECYFENPGTGPTNVHASSVGVVASHTEGYSIAYAVGGEVYCKIIYLGAKGMRLAAPKIAAITAEPKLSIYPNPSSSELHIGLTGFNANEAMQVTIHDLTGKLVATKICKANAAEACMQNWFKQANKGIYFVQLKQKEKIGNSKLIKL
jgi:Secretion system C-terminal sorting domain